VVVSVAAVWEIAIKRALGKLDAPDDLEAQLAKHDFSTLPISVRHALAAGALKRHHNDPFDRMLIAQAMLEGLTIVTRDSRFGQYGVPLLPA
jgi:PIN domain nuclease of toxin-antitoxin system